MPKSESAMCIHISLFSGFCSCLGRHWALSRVSYSILQVTFLLERGPSRGYIMFFSSFACFFLFPQQLLFKFAPMKMCQNCILTAYKQLKELFLCILNYYSQYKYKGQYQQTFRLYINTWRNGCQFINATDKTPKPDFTALVDSR